MELSAEEKIRVASNLILLAPPGELTEVFNGVRVLLNDDNLLQQHVNTILNRYHKEQFQQARSEEASSGDSVKTLITKHNELKNGRFLDPSSGATFQFDHLKRAVTDVTPSGGSAAPNSRLEPLRRALQERVGQYVTNHYFAGSGLACVVCPEAQPNSVVVCIESHHVKKFIVGRWRSEWTITCGADSSDAASVRGCIRVQTHIYEEGNVQLVSSTNKQFSLDMKDADAFANAFVAKIKRIDEEYQRGISKNFENLPDTTFKHLRRQLPVTRSKLDWDKMSGYNLASEMANAS